MMRSVIWFAFHMRFLPSFVFFWANKRRASRLAVAAAVSNVARSVPTSSSQASDSGGAQTRVRWGGFAAWGGCSVRMWLVGGVSRSGGAVGAARSGVE